MSNKKFIYIIVEGDSDESYVYAIIDELMELNNIDIMVVRGDLFTQNCKIKNTIGNFVKTKILDIYNLEEEDISMIIQVTDIDGVYIEEDCILIDSEVERIEYNSQGIKVCDENKKAEIASRNKRKVSNLNPMINTKVMKIDYYLLYNSCNLEHLIFNEANLEADKKVDSIDKHILSKTRQELLDELEPFCLYEGEDIAEQYRNSWTTIKSERQCIPRATNLPLIIDLILSKT
ncbi:hypothetical protein [Salinicoccus roseus]|uniref:hypothetical protein n=1 Tax=Salinicoccus roseus TaxID=45670 RepID=UPI0023017FF2|nr:hypothetical protein [Salinicoccus roseus]